ncbi:hypothetical protein [Phytohabitans rumicis]|uniref:Lipoprotein n=1 Tax=Phytohabitans rumicis TaxID=1076125 RepID=A0A6V8L6R1_9ACTN|nr:hypothetical protein [Phytohabitans rumicis]GFJ92943.1 hypothetical protein Prum_065850 [Phytohabitans rumicis]
MLGKRVIPVVVAAMLLLTACGAPEYEYVKNSDHKTYFKIPSTWEKVNQDSLDEWAVGADPSSATAKIRDQLLWTVAYDADADDPAVSHVYGMLPTPKPVAWAKVEQLLPEQSDSVSFDALRNAVMPFTTDARDAATQAGSMLTDFEPLRDEVLTPEKGLHGVRVVFNYSLLGQLHTFDLTALVNDDASLLYMLFIRCTAKCYADRADELEGIVTSFTVRS